jgi:hypothetical protein
VTRRLLWSYLTMAAFVLAVLEIPLGVVFARNEETNLTTAVERDATVVAGVAEDTLERGVAADLDRVVATYQRRTNGRPCRNRRRRRHLGRRFEPPCTGTT